MAPWTPPATITAAADLSDAPTWAPILFAGGAFLVVVLVLILMWKKLKQSESWRSSAEDPEADPEDDLHGDTYHDDQR